ncbi:hypothetical protein CLIM01_03403 [Colletotrichum limetticola]|uniref:Uncharacterized protein n=1 Tax=Colletotrichum limetticola TaxID=1209924 RepID=A0ABQ9Q672_9PEZI|nr:hypothetical protein CLIM01_03403 [Colletotrichum limetticola]
MGERTGSRVFQWVWSYVVESKGRVAHIVRSRTTPSSRSSPHQHTTPHKK